MTAEQIAAVLVVLLPLLTALQAYIVVLTHKLDKRVSVNEVKLDGEMTRRDARIQATERVVTQQGIDAATAAGVITGHGEGQQYDAPRQAHQGRVSDHATVRTIKPGE